ncbi:MAG: hypothetical protein U1C56_02615, partial [Candidatus Curtissbacteria bacterium]|nr:hypothetical protein [Candidatus Curtissbacteria bacterium]
MALKLAACASEPDNKDSRRNVVKVHLLETAAPGGRCPQACVHCGAFGKEDVGRQRQLTHGEIEENFTRAIPSDDGSGEEKRAVDYFDRLVTTGPDTDSVVGTAFAYAARRLHELSDGRSKLLDISHGVRVSPVPERQRDMPYIAKTFSLFNEHVELGQDLVDWGGCLQWVFKSDLESGVKNSIYSAFARKLKRKAEKQAALNKDGDSETLMLECLAAMSRSEVVDERVTTYLLELMASSPEIPDANDLMLDHLDVFKGFQNTGIIKKAGQETSPEERNLNNSVALMQRGVVPGFILTVDMARGGGKIPLHTNFYSYVRTLELLKPALAKDSPAFVAV